MNNKELTELLRTQSEGAGAAEKVIPGHPDYRYAVAEIPGGDAVNPQHYKSHPSGVEAIEITEHFNFCLGNAIKYIWRSGQKGDRIEDLKKARWYLGREITRLETEEKEKLF